MLKILNVKFTHKCDKYAETAKKIINQNEMGSGEKIAAQTASNYQSVQLSLRTIRESWCHVWKNADQMKSQ